MCQNSSFKDAQAFCSNNIYEPPVLKLSSPTQATVQQKARIYSEELNEELLEQTSQAQAESSLLQKGHMLQEQTEQWREALNKVSVWGDHPLIKGVDWPKPLPHPLN